MLYGPGWSEYVRLQTPEAKERAAWWHTQGAGKNLKMICLAGKLITHPEMKNPTLVVVTVGNVPRSVAVVT